MSQKPLNIDGFCDNDEQELFDQDPRIILKNNKTEIEGILENL